MRRHNLWIRLSTIWSLQCSKDLHKTIATSNSIGGRCSLCSILYMVHSRATGNEVTDIYSCMQNRRNIFKSYFYRGTEGTHWVRTMWYPEYFIISTAEQSVDNLYQWLDNLASLLGLAHSIAVTSSNNRIPGVFHLSKLEEQSFWSAINKVCHQWHIKCAQNNYSATFVFRTYYSHDPHEDFKRIFYYIFGKL